MRILLVVYDNDSYIFWFAQGLTYFASVIRKLGYELHIYNQDVYYWPNSHLKGKVVAQGSYEQLLERSPTFGGMALAAIK